jgi:multidrug resistance efflux pump
MTLSEDAIAEAVADQKRAGAMMWMGAILGGMFIAVMFLGFTLYQTMYGPTNSVASLSKEKATLQDKFDTASRDLSKAQQELKTVTERDNKYIEVLTKENADLRKGLRPKVTPPLASFDPFAQQPR